MVDNSTFLVPLITMLKLFCYVRGDNYSNTFIVNINEDETVADLRKAIKEKKRPQFDDVPADSLSLWKASVLIDRDLKESVEALNLVEGDSLCVYETLSDIFSSGLEKRCVHIIINRPLSGEFVCQDNLLFRTTFHPSKSNPDTRGS